jgi:hypothetical protein
MLEFAQAFETESSTMKRVPLRLFVLTSGIAIIASVLWARPFSFSDDFNTGLSAGWLFGTNPQGALGTWRLDSGALLQDAPGDAFVALVDDFLSSNQEIQTDVWLKGPAGYGGITTWYADVANWTAVFVYPAGGGVWVLDTSEGVTSNTYYANSFSETTWYRLRVTADGQTNTLSVSVNGSHLFDHALSPRHRSGLSGLYSGNSGGYFDNVELRISPPRRRVR